MLSTVLKRLVLEDDGMEMVEWSIVGVVFALAGALLWSTLNTNIKGALGSIGDCVSDPSSCPQQPTPNP
jgi:Flp pilus assembly pilin Flp